MLEAAFRDRGLRWGAPIFLRFHKYNQTRLEKFFEQFAQASKRFVNNFFYTGATLEVWVESAPGAKYELFQAYPVCAYSGKLGPKQREGDGQSPEGFYQMTSSLFNPNSQYRLSVNVGYPNARDVALHYTGGSVMIHGYCASIGCLAMQDHIDAVYTIMEQAILSGAQRAIPFHAFPYPMSEQNVERASQLYPQHEAFWRQLQVGWRAFEATHVPPTITIEPQTANYIVQERGEPLDTNDDHDDDDNNVVTQQQQ